MKSSTFSVKVDFDKSENFNENGLDDIEFMISTNVGDEEKSLIKIASGGEISRIMLAIKTVLADTDEVIDEALNRFEDVFKTVTVCTRNLDK